MQKQIKGLLLPTVADLNNYSKFMNDPNPISFCEQLEGWFLYVPSSSAVIDGVNVLATGDGGSTRWIRMTLPPSKDADNIYIARVATTSQLPGTPVYNNGIGGVGATLTGNGDITIIDGVSMSVGDIVLVRQEPNQIHNGLYEITSLSVTNYVLTRVPFADETDEITNSIVNIQLGTDHGTKSFFQETIDPIVGTDNIVFTPINDGLLKMNLFNSHNLSFTATPVSYPITSPRKGYFAHGSFWVGCFSHNYAEIKQDGTLAFLQPKLPGTKETGIYVNKKKQRVYAVDQNFMFIYNYAGTLIAQYPTGITSQKISIVAEHNRIGIVDIDNGTFRIYNELTGTLIGVITIGSPGQTFHTNYYNGFVYVGTNGSIRKIAMRTTISQQAISGVGFTQSVIKTQNLLLATQLGANAITMVDTTNFVTSVFDNILTQPRGFDSNEYLVGIGFFSPRQLRLYDPYDFIPLYTSPVHSANVHLTIFGGNKVLSLAENGTGYLITINGGITLPSSGFSIRHDVATNNTYIASSNGTIRRIDAF